MIKKVVKNMAEDGEILSSPDVDEGVEITLHADVGISSDEDLLGNSPKGKKCFYDFVCSFLESLRINPMYCFRYYCIYIFIDERIRSIY